MPIVALESTIITHGLPYPDNLKCARNLENIIRNKKCVPATIAILNGEMCVGIDDEQLEYMSQNAKSFKKCSRRDLSLVLSQKLNGSTTVSATMVICKLSGIKIFVTGGIGGVHRGVAETWDVSADLIEFSQTNVAVVSAGAKSILDIPRTLEYLETFGVPVIGYGTMNFPEFFISNSGYKCSGMVKNAEEAAKLLKYQFEVLKLQNGVLIANPVPVEQEAEGQLIKKCIE